MTSEGPNRVFIVVTQEHGREGNLALAARLRSHLELSQGPLVLIPRTLE
jgi:hypothetical protein